VPISSAPALPADPSSSGLAADSRSLDALRRAASADPAKAVRQVATQFEALFLQSVLKSMRDATPKSGLLDSDEQQLGQELLDQQLAQKIAAGGTGLADVIVRQLQAAGAIKTAQAAGAITTAQAPASTPAAQPSFAPGASAGLPAEARSAKAGGKDPLKTAVKQVSTPE